MVKSYELDKILVLGSTWGIKIVNFKPNYLYSIYFQDELAIFFSYICYNLFSLSQYLLDIFVIKNHDGSLCR